MATQKPKPIQPVKEIKKKKTKKKEQKVHQRLQNQDKRYLAATYKALPKGKKGDTAKTWGISRQNLSNWNNSKPLRFSWESRSQNRSRYCMNPNDTRNVGKYYKQQRKVYNLYRYMRAKGDPIDSKWFQDTMILTCEKDKPEGYDPTKDKFGNKWKHNFCRRWEISFQRRTNKKCHSIFERLHMIKNYQFYTIYLLGNKKPGRRS